MSAHIRMAQLRIAGTEPASGAGTDRRSITRPVFTQSWRKNVVLPGGKINAHSRSQRVEVWIARSEAILRSTSAHALLTDADRSGFVKLRPAAARNEAVAARVLLRLALSHAAGRRIAPKDWRFRKTGFGKPLVCNREAKVRFSVSHAGSLIVVAASTAINLGVDVESIDQDLSADVIKNFSHATEHRALEPLPVPQKTREFIQLWTKKEAYTKLLGLGHSMEFSGIECLRRATLPTGEHSSGLAAHFESFYVPVDLSLYHASLAINSRILSQHPVEISFNQLVAPCTDDAAFSIPVIN